MRLLLDTQIYLWFLADSARLSKAAKREIQDADDVFISAASIWEASIKAALGKLAVDPAKLVEGIQASGFTEMPIQAAHGVLASALPLHHRDPFDRMLVAQALAEPAHLLTADSLLSQYSELVHVI
ncbi:MAG: type II toxin-antitoxin system VapC family toxin [Burkholderiales bacterium]|nr:type II toxin-antitoxin system VapC family toxin [Burkholderiales bacterium]